MIRPAFLWKYFAAARQSGENPSGIGHRAVGRRPQTGAVGDA
jgi:hypothetical protein